jgi:hypothetical protein
MIKYILASVLMVASTASAQEIQLNSGSLLCTNLLFCDFPAIHLTGDRAFSFEGVGADARVDAADCALDDCDAGETYSLFMTVNGNDLGGVAELDGVTYTDVGGLSSPNQMTLTMTGFARVPRRLGPSRIRRQRIPVVVGGSFTHAMPDPLAPVTETLTGRAIAVVTWQVAPVEPSGVEPGARIITRLRYVIF